MSAVAASPTLGVEDDLDAVRALQRKLYRAAKADPGRRFHALYDKVHRRDVLERAWVQVWRNGGAPGIDRTTIADVERQGISVLLDELEAELRERRFTPLPARRVYIPKPGRDELRPLSIPAIRDRVVQAALKIVLEPIFEADMLACSFGFRPKRSAHDALQVVLDESFGGRRWVVETDIANCFTAIPHDRLMSALSERICDRNVLALLHAFLRAGVMEDGAVRRPVSGTPQGGVISPLLCNVYLTWLDRAWRPGWGRLVRYADDLLVMCRSRGQAQAALAKLTTLLAGLGLEPKPDKTRIVQLVEGRAGVRLPRLPPSARALTTTPRNRRVRLSGPLALPTGGATRPAPHPIHDDASPARRAGRPGRGGSQPLPPWLDRILPVRQLGLGVRQDQQLRPHADRAVHCQAAPAQPLMGVRPGLPVPGEPGAGLPQRNRRRPQAQPALAGSGRTPPVKDVGEPCAGELHARFDGRALETEQPRQGNRGPRAGALRNATTMAWAGTTSPVTLPPRQRSTQPSSA